MDAEKVKGKDFDDTTPRYIDADKIPYYKPCGCADCTGDCQNCKVEDIVRKTDIYAIPTADVQKIKHAKWTKASEKANVGMKCSNCNARIKYSEYFNGNHMYCHKCGSRMDL